MSDFFLNEGVEHCQVAEATFHNLQNEFNAALDICVKSIQQGGKLMLFGNGGSAADAQHLATEFTVRFIKDRAPIAALALTTDTSCLTAIGNDYGYNEVFSRQITALGRPEDVIFAISTSGTSPNVISAIMVARKLGIKVIGMTGQEGGSMNEICDVIFKIPSKTTSRVQEMHITIGHILCGAIEQNLGLVQS